MPDQQQFLEKTANFILQKDKKDLLNTLVVFPNNRSEIFLKNHLKQQAKTDLWLPEMLTIDELMARLSGLNLPDPLAVALKLYEIHRTIEGDKARSLDDFLSWAPLMLNDFNEIDYYLTPAQSLFSELSNVKALEKWNPDGKPLTVLQQQYLDFFHSLFEYYTGLQQLLSADKTAYPALSRAASVYSLRLYPINLPGAIAKKFVPLCHCSRFCVQLSLFPPHRTGSILMFSLSKAVRIFFSVSMTVLPFSTVIWIVRN